VSGAGTGAENGAEWARKADERERSGAGAGLEKMRLSGSGAGGRVSGSGAVSGLNRPLTIRSNLTIIDC